MPLVIADTSPINYLIQIGHIDILPVLFERVTLPSAVRDELTAAPPMVRDWIACAPTWVAVAAAARVSDDTSMANSMQAKRKPLRLPSSSAPI